MSTSEDRFIAGEILEQHVVLSLADLCRLCTVEEQLIVEFVEEGVLEVLDRNSTPWRFGGAALKRTRIALRLQRDLDVNLPGVALALELLEELDHLRRETRNPTR